MRRAGSFTVIPRLLVEADMERECDARDREAAEATARSPSINGRTEVLHVTPIRCG
jgi:hypothetical protein